MKVSKVVNLADIHFRNMPDKGSVGGRRNSAYFKSIETEICKIKPTHIVINGDMVFSGDFNQYELCYEALLKKYLDSAPHARLILVAGNHCIQRTIPTTLLSECGIEFKDVDLKSHSGKEDLEVKIKEKLEGNASLGKEVLKKLAIANSNIGDYKDYLRGKEFDLFSLLFYSYSQFVVKYVISRFDNINQREEVIDFKSYKDSKGLHGVIYDKEYHLVFACLNSVGYAWGKETFEQIYSSKAEMIKILYQEYGNLGLGISAKSVDNDLDYLAENNVLDQSTVILLTHVPLSWLDYYTNYKNASLDHIMAVTDIALFGHIHVPHFAPTIYRNQTYIFESPQLYDFKFDEFEDDEINSNYIQSIGFSVFDFFKNNYNYGHAIYKLTGENIFKQIKRKYQFLWKEERREYLFLRPKKTIFNCYDCLGTDNNTGDETAFVFLSENCGFSKYIKRKAVQRDINTIETIQINNDSYINFDSFCGDYFSQFDTTKLKSSDERFKYILYKDILNIFVVVKSKDSYGEIIYDYLTHKWLFQPDQLFPRMNL